MREQTATLAQLLSRIEASNQIEHYRTRDMMIQQSGYMGEDGSELKIWSVRNSERVSNLGNRGRANYKQKHGRIGK
jgi:hypothetical protein